MRLDFKNLRFQDCVYVERKISLVWFYEVLKKISYCLVVLIAQNQS